MIDSNEKHRKISDIGSRSLAKISKSSTNFRSLSYSQVHFVTSLSSDDSEEGVKPQNDINLRTLGRTTSHPNYRRSSLTSALEAIANEASAYTNLGVIIGGSICFFFDNDSHCYLEVCAEPT